MNVNLSTAPQAGAPVLCKLAAIHSGTKSGTKAVQGANTGPAVNAPPNRPHLQDLEQHAAISPSVKLAYSNDLSMAALMA